MNHPRRSIAVLVVVAVLITTTAVLGIFAAFNYRVERSRRLEALHSDQRLLADQLAVSLALPAWNFDHAQIDKIIESTMRGQDVSAVAVKLADVNSTLHVRTRDERWANVVTNHEPSVDGLLLENRNIRVGDETVGTVKLLVTPRFTYAALKHDLWSMLWSILFFDVLLVMVLYLLIFRLVLQPIRKLERHAEAISNERGGDVFPADASMPGELEHLRNSLDRMLALLRARHEALQISEEKFVKAFHANPVPIVITRLRDGLIIEGNEAFARRYQTTPEEAKGKSALDIGVWSDPMDRQLVVNRLKIQGRLYDFERSTILPSGEVRVSLLSFQIMEMRGEECLVTVAQDITERRQAELALRESEEKFSRAFHFSPAPMGFTRLRDGKCVDVNQAFIDTFGFQREEIIGRTTTELGFWPDATARKRFVERLGSGKTIQNEEMRCPTKNGRTLHTQFSSVTMDIGGETLLLSVFVDVTARKQSEELTETQRAVFEKIASGSPLSEALELLLRFIESQAPDMICSILLMDADRIRLKHCAGASLPPELVKAIDGSTIGPKAGSCGTAAHTGSPVFVSDIETDPLWAEYKDLALRHGFNACWSMPILDPQRRVLGTFAIYHRKPGLPNEWQCRLMEAASHTALVCIAKHRSDEALRASEERFALAVRGSTDGLWDWNPNTNEVYYAPRFRELLGYDSPAEFPPTLDTFFSHLHPSDRDRIWNAIRAHLDAHVPYDVEYRIATRGGLYRWFRARGQAIWDKVGHPMRMAGSITDVTERKHAEFSLRESENRFRALVEFSPECIVVVSGGLFVYVNPSGMKMMGATQLEQLIGRSIFDVVPEAQRDRAREKFRMVLEEGKAAPMEERALIRLDGVSIPIEVISVPFAYAGQPAILILIRDITARKKAEQERTEATQREHAAHAEYTRLLIASQEAERRRIAGELHDSLGQNLLLIRNRVQQALTPKHADGVKEQLTAIGELTSAAITEVRHISRDLRPYQLDQLGLTYALQALIDGVAKSTDIRFDHRLDKSDDVLSGDNATNLYRIVQESLNNILKHAGARQVKIELERDVRHVRLWISDDGRGFTVAPLNALGSEGLGLRNIAERVRILNGSLALKSEPGRGTSIEVIVPVAG